MKPTLFAASLLFLLAYFARAEVLLHWPGLDGEVGTMEQMLALEGKTLSEQDTLVLEGKVIADETTNLTLAGLVLRSAEGKPSAFYMDRLALVVNGDILVQGGLLAVQSGRLQWSGNAVLEPDPTGRRIGAFEYVLGDSRAEGDAWSIGSASDLTFRIFRGLNAQKLAAGNAEPVRLTGALSLGTDVIVTLVFDPMAVSELADLPPGSYPLITAASIDGTLPSLRLKRGESEEPNTRYSLEIRGGELLLNVAE